MESPPVAHYAHTWGLALIRGLAAVFFGLSVLVWPGLTVVLFVWLLGIYAAADGLASILTALASPGVRGRLWLGLAGLATLAAGALAFAAPWLFTVSLLLILGVWGVARGVFELAAAALMDSQVANPRGLALGAMVSMLLGVLIIARPLGGVLALTWLIGGWSIAYGLVAILWAFHLRRLAA
jgi:uncharacterized membrane protein HdeD (DUF308 family)